MCSTAHVVNNNYHTATVTCTDNTHVATTHLAWALCLLYTGVIGLTSSHPVPGDPMSLCGLEAACSKLPLTLGVTSQSATLLGWNQPPQIPAVQRVATAVRHLYHRRRHLQNCTAESGELFLLVRLAKLRRAGVDTRLTDWCHAINGSSNLYSEVAQM